ALTVLGHSAFEAGRWADAERHYADVLSLGNAASTTLSTPERRALEERLAASIYRQGEAARSAGRFPEAAGHFARVATAAPQSDVRVNAQYDAAAALLSAQDWAAAVPVLEDFRSRYPGHPLQAELGPKLVLAYTELGRWAPAAQEVERLAQTAATPELARNALWQAAELHEKAGNRPQATAAWERYVQRHPLPLTAAVEARAHLLALARQAGQTSRELTLQREILQADQGGGEARSPRTRLLGAQAALALVAPALASYREVALVEPLQKQLKVKKAKLEAVLQATALAADYGVAEVVTAATFQTAALYQDFGQALMRSERPKRLSKDELAQYDVLLEEQAFPFEEKAIALHQVNAARAQQGVYDRWVQQSFDALRTLRPARYGKAERVETPATEAGTASLSQVDEALSAEPANAALHNRRGVLLRGLGRFGDARAAYEQALTLKPDYADAALNLGVLLDLYQGDKAGALTQFERYLALTPGGDAAVSKWVLELKNRKDA
ncbi:tetratricopeptide repeat protein, partial [Ideonella sp.]|uniref:tetratricopeptide repeat protein n=1 Tax=Ideonella sp. TaxID=1929293 RepID=UPI003BB6D81D